MMIVVTIEDLFSAAIIAVGGIFMLIVFILAIRDRFRKKINSCDKCCRMCSRNTI